MHLRYASPSLIRQLQHELSVELKMRAVKKDEGETGSKRKGWKEEVDAGDVPSWKKAKSGGDWRSGSRAMPAGEDASRTSYGRDGPAAGTNQEYDAEQGADSATGGKMRGWRDDEGVSAAPQESRRD